MKIGRLHDYSIIQDLGRAIELVPEKIQSIMKCQVHAGIDPVFSGESRDFDEAEIQGVVYNYRDLAYCEYDWAQTYKPSSNRITTVFLPSNKNYKWGEEYGLRTVIHELGHSLHQYLGYVDVAPVTTEYSRTNPSERFAEYFQKWVLEPDAVQQNCPANLLLTSLTL